MGSVYPEMAAASAPGTDRARMAVLLRATKRAVRIRILWFEVPRVEQIMILEQSHEIYF